MLTLARLKDRFKAMAKPSKRAFRIVQATLVVLALAWQHIEATRLGYKVETARRQAHLLRGQLHVLQMDLQTSLSPAQLAYQARSKLGMQPANPECLRLLGHAQEAATNDSFLTRLLSRTWRSLAASLNT